VQYIAAVWGPVTAPEIDPIELSLGFDLELFAGVPGETRNERRTRLAVAREVLRDLFEVDPQAAQRAKELMRAASRSIPSARKDRAARRSSRKAVAA
jgi:hypothetical protein